MHIAAKNDHSNAVQKIYCSVGKEATNDQLLPRLFGPASAAWQQSALGQWCQLLARPDYCTSRGVRSIIAISGRGLIIDLWPSYAWQLIPMGRDASTGNTRPLRSVDICSSLFHSGVNHAALPNYS